MKVYVLFQTDVWKTHSSRVFFGVFRTEKKAFQAARDNDLFGKDAGVVIIETELDKFAEA